MGLTKSEKAQQASLKRDVAILSQRAIGLVEEFEHYNSRLEKRAERLKGLDKSDEDVLVRSEALKGMSTDIMVMAEGLNKIYSKL